MKKLKCFGYSLFPMFIWMLIQVIVTSGFTVVMIAIWGFIANTGIDTAGFAEYLKKDYLSIVSVLINAIFLIPGYFWFQSLKRREIPDKSSNAEFSWKAWFRFFLLGIILQFGMSIILTIIQILSPEVMESHTNALESLGMFNPTIFSVLYVAVLAPVTEELIYRGLTLKILEKEFPFWAANLLQACGFGLMHGNLVQGSYAFLMGLLLGKTVQKYGAVKASIFLHFVINLIGLFLGNINVNFQQKILIILISFVFLFLSRGKNKNR